MATIEVVEVVAPAGWASALVNGDESSFDYHNDPTDRADYERFCAWLTEHGLSVVSTACSCNRDDGGCDVYPDECPPQEARFTNNGHLYHSSYDGVDVLDYVCHRHTENPRPPTDSSDWPTWLNASTRGNRPEAIAFSLAFAGALVRTVPRACSPATNGARRANGPRTTPVAPGATLAFSEPITPENEHETHPHQTSWRVERHRAERR